MSAALPIRVIGVGSPFGDDSVGWEVVRRIQQVKEWGTDFEFHTLEGGQRLLDVLDGRGTLVIIDAAAAESLEPGTIERIEWPDPRLETLRPGSTHQVLPAEALSLANTLGLLPSAVVIWTIAGESFTPQADLTSRVSAAVLDLTNKVANELEDIQSRGIAHHA